MPSVRSRLAPHFSGEIEYPVKDFLCKHEELADEYGLMDVQKVEMVIWYVDRSECHIWTSLLGYINRNWDDMWEELAHEYVDPSTENCFSKQKLVDFADKYARRPMTSETDVINYHRKFNNLAKILVTSGCITRGKRNAIFWRGFHPDDQQSLCERLIAKQPNRPRGRAFKLTDVLETARAVFSGDDDFLLQELPPRQDSDRAREQRTEPDTYSRRESKCKERAHRREHPCDSLSFKCQESGDEEAPSSDQEQYLTWGHRHSSPRIETKTIRFQDNNCKAKELEDLVRQLHDLSVQDREYTVVYAKCSSLFPDAMLGIPKLGYRDGLSSSSYTYQATSPPPPTVSTWSVQTSPPPPTVPTWSVQNSPLVAAPALPTSTSNSVANFF